MKKIILSVIAAYAIVTTSNVFAVQNSNDINRVVKYNGKIVKNGGPINYAHRAGRGLLPEQTMPAYKEALRLGVDYVDMDINMTKDGVLVITHDLGLNPNLTRDENGNWVTDPKLIHSMTYAELKKYNVGEIKPGTVYGKLFPYQRPCKFAKFQHCLKLLNM